MFLAVWEMRIALWMGLSTYVSMICLCVALRMALTSVFCMPCVRKEAPRGFRTRAGVFICWASVDWSWSRSVSVKSVAAFSVGITVCQAVHGAAACRCTAEPTPSPPIRNGRWKSGEVTSLPAGCDQ